MSSSDTPYVQGLLPWIRINHGSKYQAWLWHIKQPTATGVTLMTLPEYLQEYYPEIWVEWRLSR